jgi:hypothetical protein
MVLNLDIVKYNVWKTLKETYVAVHVDNFYCCLTVALVSILKTVKAAASNGYLDVTRELLGNEGCVHIEGNVTGQHDWQQLIVATWKFSVNS